jgi:hypothetical protein
MLTRAVSLVLLPWLCGCTTVQVHNAEVRERVYPGWVRLEIRPAAQGATLVRSQGLGLVLGPRSLSLGWLDEVWWSSRDAQACRVLLVLRDAAQAKGLLASPPFKDGMQGLCVLQAEKEMR